MNNRRIDLGKKGEDISVKFLKKQGYQIIERNYRCSLGEIDIIAKDKNILCFVEVKTRNTEEYGLPEEAIDGYKQKKLARAALTYLKQKKIYEQDLRFDIVSVYPDRIELIKDAFVVDEGYTY
ncbi:MAG: YraN family protein [Elusimicrobiota bacterium]|nr:YraN family protein [Elusimicrobiota bacterium]